MWTNAARVDPEAFEVGYNIGGCSFYEQFSEDEQTPKPPTAWSFGLNDAARYHSEDMEANSWFSHDSSDGTSFPDRMARYYSSGFIGENIAMGSSDPEYAVMSMWMCSTDGHRENIMSGSWDELGTGVAGSYLTQDFGSGGAPERVIAMGTHTPAVPDSDAHFYVDFHDEMAPERFVVVLDGQPQELMLRWGIPEMGMYDASVEVPEGTCHTYYFDADGVRWPAEGSYGWGTCEWDDAGARWVLDQSGSPEGGKVGTDPDDLKGAFELVGGCSSVGGSGLLWFAFLSPLCLRGRRRLLLC